MSDSKTDTTADNQNADSGKEGETQASITGAETKEEITVSKADWERLNKGNAKLAGELRDLQTQIDADKQAAQDKIKEDAEKSGDLKKQLDIAVSERDDFRDKFESTNTRLRDMALRDSLKTIAKTYTTCSDAAVDLLINDFDFEQDSVTGKTVPKLKHNSALDPESYLKGEIERRFPGTAPSTREQGTGLKKTEQQGKPKAEAESLPDDFDSKSAAEKRAFFRENPKLRKSLLKRR